MATGRRVGREVSGTKEQCCFTWKDRGRLCHCPLKGYRAPLLPGFTAIIKTVWARLCGHLNPQGVLPTYRVKKPWRNNLPHPFVYVRKMRGAEKWMTSPRQKQLETRPGQTQVFRALSPPSAEDGCRELPPLPLQTLTPKWNEFSFSVALHSHFDFFLLNVVWFNFSSWRKR